MRNEVFGLFWLMLCLSFVGGCYQRQVTEPLEFSDVQVQRIRDAVDAVEW